MTGPHIINETLTGLVTSSPNLSGTFTATVVSISHWWQTLAKHWIFLEGSKCTFQPSPFLRTLSDSHLLKSGPLLFVTKNLSQLGGFTRVVLLYYISTHSPIGSGAGQHFVDAHDVEGVWSDPQVEGILTTVLHQILVGADTSGFQSLWRRLFQFVWHEMYAQRKLVYASLLTSQIIDTDLWIWGKNFEKSKCNRNKNAFQ